MAEDLLGALDGYLALLRQAGRAASTVMRYRSILNVVVERGPAAAFEGELAPATRLLRYKVVGAFFRWAAASGYLDSEPV